MLFFLILIIPTICVFFNFIAFYSQLEINKLVNSYLGARDVSLSEIIRVVMSESLVYHDVSLVYLNLDP